ncbi:M-phase phosphoprotein 6 isoform X3 [Nilaparvata lugens]|uniref:M-phase phosphoprotein 6 isoform X3 n=1 Tax=Nilaparvata lugens TaxID=108931 RepID=UPI000B987925|nr:M-phase phosphoprotein 6 isoform X3 [Nilaparvata lugens]
MNDRKRKLSKAILDMKFMKKTKDKVEKELEKKETEDLFSSQITDEMKFGKNFIIEPSIARCKELINGRLSFNGMNPEIEREMFADKEGATTSSAPQTKSADVSDMEMAKYQMSITNTVAKKFQKKNERHSKVNVRPNKKVKFLKPNDDD